jgi:site-specific DNA-methyltransferase (adenine-specific)
MKPILYSLSTNGEKKMRNDPSINLHLGCSLQAMREMEDNQYDLAIVDPPYGVATPSAFQGSGKLKNRSLNRDTKIQRWDQAPTVEYFEQLFRVSKEQIIWGGNYFNLPPTRCVIAWDKVQPWENFSGWEMGWTSFNKPAPLFKFDNRRGGKIHATQKPIALYKWCLEKFASPGDKILDSHLGSGSIACACYDLGFDLDAWELDPEYFKRTLARYKEHSKQTKLF